MQYMTCFFLLASHGIFCSLYYYAVLYWLMDPHQSHDGLFPMHEESLSRESNWFLNSMCLSHPFSFSDCFVKACTNWIVGTVQNTLLLQAYDPA